VVELFRRWKKDRERLDPDTWLDLALPSWTILPVMVPVARQSVPFPWEHTAPADRLLTATALVEGVVLWHTDTMLEKLTGLLHRYFQNRLENPPDALPAGLRA
jgi:PIN domain nuclease of toxin-antitoxin system